MARLSDPAGSKGPGFRSLPLSSAYACCSLEVSTARQQDMVLLLALVLAVLTSCVLVVAVVAADVRQRRTPPSLEVWDSRSLFALICSRRS